MSQRAAIVTVGTLLLALVASNLWWFYRFADIAVTEKYHDQMLYERLHALRAAHLVLPSLAAELPRDEVIRRVEAALDDPRNTFETEGWVIVDWVHLRFDDSGRLVEIGPDFE
jgi:hypothetical protein